MDLMFVPSPDAICARLGAWLDLPAHVHALDPCCGTGAALDTVTGGRGTRYGIELELDRAKVAQERLDKVLVCAAQEARLSRGAFGLVFLNPPYDDSVFGRLETQFLERAVDWLCPGGVLIYIIKHGHYTGRVLRILSRNFTDFRHWSFPKPYFDGPDLAFGQTVMVCRRRATPLQLGDPFAYAAKEMGVLFDNKGALPPPPMPEDLGERYKGEGGHAPDIFFSGALTPEVYQSLLVRSPLRRVPPRVGRGLGRPPMPLTDGHVALVLASGAVDGVYGHGDLLHVAKGTVSREKVETKTLVGEGDRGPSGVVVTTVDSFEIAIRAAFPDGRIERIGGGVHVPQEDGEEQEAGDDE